MTSYNRREFTRMALLALPAGKLFTAARFLGAAEFAGVQIGLNVPYSFGNNNMGADEVLKNCVQLGVGSLELRSQPVEAFLGAPVALPAAPRTADSATR